MKLTKTKSLAKSSMVALFAVMLSILLIPFFAVVTHSAKASEISNSDNQFTFNVDNDSVAFLRGTSPGGGYGEGYFVANFGDNEDLNYAQVTSSGQIIVNVDTGEVSTASFNELTGQDTESDEVETPANAEGVSNFPSDVAFAGTNDLQYNKCYSGTTIISTVCNPGYTFDKWKIKQGSSLVDVEVGKKYTLKDVARDFVATTKACGALSGTVVNGGPNSNGDPIFYASVEFYNNSFYAQTRTNWEGNFEISADAENGGMLEITYSGFRSYIISLTPEQVKSGDLGEISLYTVKDSVTLSGTVIAKDQDASEWPVGGVMLYYVPDGKDPIFTYSNNMAALSNMQCGEYSISIDKNLPGLLYAIDSTGSIVQKTPLEVPASGADRTGFNVYVEYDDDGVAVAFSANSTEGKILKNSDDCCSFVVGNYKLNNRVLADWDTGTVSITDDNGNVTTYTPIPNEGYAFYDWSIRDFNGGWIEYKFDDVLTTNAHYTALFRPAGKYIATSEDENHKEFKCTHTSQEFPGEANFHHGDSLEEQLYAGTEITLKDGKLLCHYQDSSETTYWKDDTIQAIGQDGYTVDKYYINGEEFVEGQSLLVGQYDVVNITATYTSADNPDVPGGGSESANAQTSDFSYQLIMLLVLLAGVSCTVLLSRKTN